jgi:hypothetical protein
MTEEECRALAAENCARFPDAPRLETIAFVGAYDAVIGGGEVDSCRLTHGLQYLLESGAPVDPAFEIDVVNFRENRDFLKETLKADLVFVSYILRHESADTFGAGTKDAIRREGYWLALNSVLSTRHCPENWLERARAAEAKLVLTFGGRAELGTDIFCGEGPSFRRTEPYLCLFPSSPRECGGYYDPGPEREDDARLGGWIGMAGDRDYLAAIAPCLGAKTMLGQRAREALLIPSSRLGDACTATQSHRLSGGAARPASGRGRQWSI